MASIDYQKIKDRSTVAALMRHNDTEERLIHDHANEHINKDQTQNNIQTRSYKQALQYFSDRIKTLDATTNTNKRKDRVEAVAVEIPLPAGDWKREQEFSIAKEYFDFLQNRYGKENICGYWLHTDEKHLYHDSLSGEKRMSRSHVHAIVIPEINGRLCCKEFTSKQAMRSANRELDGIVRERFGVQFLTGEEPKRQRVEDLKAAERTAALDKEIADRQARLAEQQQSQLEIIKEMENDIKDKTKKIEKLFEQAETKDAEIEKLHAQNKEKDNIIADLHKQSEKQDAILKKGLSYVNDRLPAAIQRVAQAKEHLDVIDQIENANNIFQAEIIVDEDAEVRNELMSVMDKYIQRDQGVIENINNAYDRYDDWER